MYLYTKRYIDFRCGAISLVEYFEKLDKFNTEYKHYEDLDKHKNGIITFLMESYKKIEVYYPFIREGVFVFFIPSGELGLQAGYFWITENKGTAYILSPIKHESFGDFEREITGCHLEQ